MSLPVGWTAAVLPLAIQLVGRPCGEAELLQAAAWCEARLALPPREPGR